MRGWVVGLQVVLGVVMGLGVSEVVAPKVAAAAGWDDKQLVVLKVIVTALMLLVVLRAFAWIERRRS